MSYIGNQPTTAAFPFDQFSGNGSTTAFTMSYAPASTTSIVVSISGVVQNPNTYSVSGLTLTFSPAPPAGTNNIAVLFLGLPASSVSTPGNTAFFASTQFTATAGQTTFSPSGTYQVGFINVIRNGSQLAPTDYTATNGINVVLANACVAGDVVVIEVYNLTTLVNGFPTTGGTITGSTIFNSSIQVGTTATITGAATFGSTVSISGAGASAYTGFKNKLINGATNIWQRGTSFAAPANLAYTADRWFSIWGTANRTVSRQAGFSGSQYCLRVARNSGTTDSSYSGVVQIIESVNLYDLQGQTVTVSFSARRGLNYSATSNALLVTLGSGTVADQGSGVYWSPGWTGITNPINTSVTLGTTEQTFSLQATIPSNCLELALTFQYLATGTAGAADYFEITNIQIERGSNATSFEFRDYGRELQMCQRYCLRLTDSTNNFTMYGSFTAASATLAYGAIQGTTMRVTPTVTYSLLALATNTVFPVTSIGAYGGLVNGVIPIQINVASGLTIGNSVFLQQNNSASAFLQLSAEL
jgi:hypothetical protein